VGKVASRLPNWAPPRHKRDSWGRLLADLPDMDSINP